MKITDKIRLDWLQARLLSGMYSQESIVVGLNAGIITTEYKLSGRSNKNLRRVLDAALRASKPSRRGRKGEK